MAVAKVPEGHHPRGSILPEALRGKFSLEAILRGLCGRLSEGSAGLCGVLGGVRGIFRAFSGVVTVCR